MPCRLPWLSVFLFASLAVASPEARAEDAFDLCTNPVLAAAPGKEGVKEATRLTDAQLIDHDRVLTGVEGAFVIVRTNDNRYSKLHLQPARQKVSDEKSIPMLLVHRFVTFKEGQERAVQASSQNIYLFPGFRLNLDIGQVVPEALGGDLRFVADGDKLHVEVLGKAKMYLVTRPLPEITPRKSEKVVVGQTFDIKYFSGAYHLHDDGRRSGKLVLTVGGGGEVKGALYSDKDGAKYEVRGRIGMPQHLIEFTVKFPRSEQFFKGWLFTGDARAIAGSSRFGEREAGFYAVRIEQP
jgi:hypothetical protein